ncbi:MAG: sulfatase-like hydrolase/transferase, partial [Thermoguttaceae bacterium]
MRTKAGLILVAIVAGLLSAAAVDSRAADASKPNILFILADDFGLDGVSCYGSDRFKGKTPNLDELAATGT